MKSRETVFQGEFLSVHRDMVELPNGNTAGQEWVEHRGAAGILALTDTGEVVMIRQHRHPAGQALLEIPAGKLEGDEAPAACAARELEEETGYRAGVLEPLGKFYPVPAYSSELLYLFLARDLKKTRQNLDADEFLNLEMVKLEDAITMCLTGKIINATALVALLTYRALREKQPAQTE